MEILKLILIKFKNIFKIEKINFFLKLKNKLKIYT